MAAVGSTLATAVSKVVPDLYITISYVLILSFVLAYNIYRLVMIVKKEAAKAPTEATSKDSTPQSTAAIDGTPDQKAPDATEKGQKSLTVEVPEQETAK